MFIFVIYKDAPELSTTLRRSSSDIDLAVEKTLLVNPVCPVRIMLEYIRKKCRLGEPSVASNRYIWKSKGEAYVYVQQWTYWLEYKQNVFLTPDSDGVYTQFDLCDESGGLKGLFNMPIYAYATDLFEYKKTYYIIVMRTENDGRTIILPQLNRENMLYEELKTRIKKFLLTGDVGSSSGTPPSKVLTVSGTKSNMKKK